MDAVRIVASIGGATRLDLNDGTTWVTTYEGTDLTPPPLRRSLAQNLMRDGGSVSASAYDFRTFKLGLQAQTISADVAGTAVQNLARTLDRDDNWLKWQPSGATNGVWFPLWRSDISAIREVPSASSKFRQFQATLFGDSHGVGAVESLGTITVNFDPAGGGNACFFDVTGVKGDVLTPLHMVTADTDLSNNQLMVATRRRGTPSNVTWFRQAESLTLGTDVTLPGNDAVASGSGSNYARCSFATVSADASRLSGTFPTSGTGSVDWRGTYRVIARMRKSNTGAVVNASISVGGVHSDPVAINVSFNTTFALYDLGLVQIPHNNAGRQAGHGTEQPVAGVTIALWLQLITSTCNIDIDYIALVPADSDLAVISTPSISGGSQVVFDGPNAAVYSLNSSDELSSVTTAPRYDGRLPRLDPKETTNRVWIWPGFNTAQTQVPVAGSAAYDVQYWPLYRYVRPLST